MSVAEIRNDGGCPELFIDGVRVLPILYGLSDIPASKSNTAQAKRNISAFSKVGINLVNADTGLHLGWRKTSLFDPEPLIEEISGVLDANPDAKILLRLHMNPPYWWLRDNPDECIIYRRSDGDHPGIDDGESDRLIRNDAAGHMRVSLASEKWLAEASDVLGKFCDSLKGTREGEALFGIQVACGIYGEWHQWGCDVSRPMRARFERYLREKYPDVESLRAAWNRSDITFETAEFRPETFRPGDDGFFRDPQKSRDTMDSQECIQITPPEAILRFCRVIKEKLPNLLAGAFYGYYLGTGGDNAVIGGHLRVDMLYKSRGIVDFLCGPFCYMDNRKSDGIPMQRGLLESSRLRGFLWLTEMDQHPVGTENYIGGDPEKTDETISVLHRNTLQPLFAGMGFWYYDHRIIPALISPDSKNSCAGSIYRKNGWWETSRLMSEIGSIQSFAEKLASENYRPAADVLLVYDTDSYFCRSKVNDFEYRIHEAVARCGVAYDCIYAGELEIAELSRYKCVIFANAYMLTPERREKFRTLLKDKKTIWLYAEGYCDGKTLSSANLSAAVGMKVKVINGAESFRGSGILPEETVTIPQNRISPMFALDDSDAVPIAYYDNGEIAAGIKDNDIWLALPLPTRNIMAALFDYCGVHSYCRGGDPIFAAGKFVAINCPVGGLREIKLRNGHEFTINLPPFTTAVFDSETGERIL
jgi:hypothetical protein